MIPLLPRRAALEHLDVEKQHCQDHQEMPVVTGRRRPSINQSGPSCIGVRNGFRLAQRREAKSALLRRQGAAETARSFPEPTETPAFWGLFSKDRGNAG